MATFLVIFLLFLLQFVYLPIGTSHFEIPKVYITEFVIFLLVVFIIFNQKKNSYKHFKKSSLIVSLLLIILTVIDLIFFRTNISFFGNYFRLQGIFLLWMLLLFAFSSSLLPILKVKTWFLLLVLCIQCFFTFIVGGENMRAVGTIGEPNALAADVIFIWPFVFFGEQQDKLYKISSIVLASIIILLSQSRSGIVGFVIQLIFILLAHKLHMPLKKTTIICLIFILISLLLPFFDQSDFYESRTQVWQNAVIAGITHPIMGSGFGNIQYALKSSQRQFSNNLGLSFVDSSHNIFLDWFVQGGITGLMILLFYLYQSFSTFIQKNENLNIVLLLGVIASLSFNPASIVTLVALFWLFGKGMLSQKNKT